MIVPREPPYASSVLSPERTIAQIHGLLAEYGCEAVQITRTALKETVIRFAVEVEVKGVRRKIGVEVRPPLLATRRRKYGRTGPVVTTEDEARSLRLAYWYLKSKLEAVAYGLVTAEREFFAQVLVSLPEGGESTVGEIAEESVAHGGNLFLPGLAIDKRPRLPPPPPQEEEHRA